MKRNYYQPLMETIHVSTVSIIAGSPKVNMSESDFEQPLEVATETTTTADSRRRDLWEDDLEEDEQL